MLNLLKLFCVGFLFLVMVACVATPGNESTGEFLDSSTTTTKVKASLVDQLGTKGFAVQVKTFKDQVQLSGFLPTLRLKQRAEIIAAHVDGVRRVHNDIIVKP